MVTGPPRRALPHPGDLRAGLQVCHQDPGPGPQVLSEERQSRPRSSLLAPRDHLISQPAVSNHPKVVVILLVNIFLPILEN